jgi:hypothetical protein
MAMKAYRRLDEEETTVTVREEDCEQQAFAENESFAVLVDGAQIDFPAQWLPALVVVLAEMNNQLNAINNTIDQGFNSVDSQIDSMEARQTNVHEDPIGVITGPGGQRFSPTPTSNCLQSLGPNP